MLCDKGRAILEKDFLFLQGIKGIKEHGDKYTGRKKIDRNIVDRYNK